MVVSPGRWSDETLPLTGPSAGSVICHPMWRKCGGIARYQPLSRLSIIHHRSNPATSTRKAIPIQSLSSCFPSNYRVVRGDGRSKSSSARMSPLPLSSSSPQPPVSPPPTPAGDPSIPHLTSTTVSVYRSQSRRERKRN